MEKNFTEQDSLKLINEMISQARNNFQESNTTTSLFCGYVVAATAFANFALIHMLDKPNQSVWIWLTMIPMIIISKILDKRHLKEAIVKTHIDKIVSSVWGAFIISIGVFLLSIYGIAFVMKSSNVGLIITPVILTMMGAAQLTTAVACRFKPYTYGAFISWIGALSCVASYFFLHRGDLQFIILGVCAILGLCLPAHIANKKRKDNNV